MRKINFPFFLGLLTVVGVLAGAAHLLHGYQVRRSARVLLVQADNRIEAGKQREAVGFLQRYLKLNPDDTQQRARLGHTLADVDLPRQAFFLFERILREDPSRTAERRRLVEVAIRIGRYQDAGEHLTRHLLKASPDDPVLHDLLGQCHAQLHDLEDARQEFEKSLELDPKAVDVYLRLAMVQDNETGGSGAAQSTLDRMVEKNGDNFKAHLTRAAYRRDHGLEGADADIARALELAPGDSDVLLLASQMARDAGDKEQARQHLKRGLELFPKMEGWYLGLAQLADDEGTADPAIEWLRQGLEAVPGHVDLMWNMAELLIQANRIEEARQVVEQLRDKEYPKGPLEYLSARISMHEGKWRPAAEALTRARVGMIAWPDLAKQADFWLAHCHGQLGNLDQQVEAYRSAVQTDRNWVPARMGLASALVNAGDVDGAIEEYTQMAAGGRAPKEVHLLRSRLMLVAWLRRRETNWQPVKEALDDAQEALPDSPQVPVLRAEVAMAEGQPDEATRVLEAARAKHPELIVLPLALAALEQRKNDWDAAEAYLDQAESDLGDSVDLRIARARLSLARDSAAAPQVLKALEENTQGFAAADRGRLLHVLASAHSMLARTMAEGSDERKQSQAEAERLWRQMAELLPDDMSPRLYLFDLALRGKNDPLMKELLADIRRIEGGEGGPLWRYGEAVRIVMAVRKDPDNAGNRPRLEEAQVLLTAAAVDRTNWARIPLLLAEIDELRRDDQRALEHYRQAVDLGEQNPSVIRRLVELLYQARQYKEADAQLQRLANQQTPFTVELGRLATQVSFQLEEMERATESARRTAKISQDYRDHMWLGQLLAKDHPQEAEASLRKAIELAEHQPAPWVALVQYLARGGRKQEAVEVVAEVREKVAGENMELVLAECYAVIEDWEAADTQYRAAVRANPDDPATLRRAAEFYLRSGKPLDAEPHLRALVDSSNEATAEDRQWARRNLAIALAAQRQYTAHRQALFLLDENLKERAGSIDDRRAKAIVLASGHGRSALEEAIALFEELNAGGSATSEDRFLLIQLYQASGNWSAARDGMLSLLASQGNNRSYISWYVRALLGRHELDQAEFWRQELEKVEGPSAQVRELAARVQGARGRYDEAIATLDQLLAAAQEGAAEVQAAEVQAAEGGRQARSQPEVTRAAIGLILEQIAASLNRQTTPEGEPVESAAAGSKKLLAAAEEHYKAHVEAQPEQSAILAQFLGRQGRVGEALQVYEPGWTSEAAETTAIGAAALLRSENATQEHIELTQRKLRRLLDRKPKSVPVLMALANLYDVKGDYGKAEQMYRKIIALDRDQMIALNNLALLAALGKGDRRESLTLINRAIEAHGPRPTLLDSRASIYMALGKSAEALEDLEVAVAEEPSGSKHFHVAQARQMAGDQQGAAAAMRQAVNEGLKAEDLHPLERDDYEKLLSKME